MSIQYASAILFGLAIGDALGWPTEFKKLPDIYQIYGASGIQELPAQALYTDDTQMTIALTQGLLDAGLDASIDDRMESVAKQFVIWANSPENNRAPGRTCMLAAQNLEKGVSWRESGVMHSKGCGSAMRVATIGYLYQHHEDDLKEVAHMSGVITHGHPAAIAASIAGAYLVKLALDQVSPEEFIARTLEFCGGISDEFDSVLQMIPEVLPWDDEDEAMQYLGEGWIAEEAIALALYCVLRYPDDYLAVIRRGANSNGDSDSIACIAGGIIGARIGLDAIPRDWREQCENSKLLDALSRRMAEERTLYDRRFL